MTLKPLCGLPTNPYVTKTPPSSEPSGHSDLLALPRWHREDSRLLFCTCPSFCGACVSQIFTKLSLTSLRSCLECHLIREALPDLYKITASHCASWYSPSPLPDLLSPPSLPCGDTKWFVCLFIACLLTRLMENGNSIYCAHCTMLPWRGLGTLQVSNKYFILGKRAGLL